MNNFLIITSLFLFSIFSYSQDYSDPVSDGEIVVEKKTDLTQNYRDRRNRFGILFSVNYEQFSPNDYWSIFQKQNFKYLSDGSNIPLVGAEFGIKLNSTLGSISGLIGYLQSEFSNESKDVYTMDAKITKASINIALDNLMTEPWVVPYGQIGIHQINWEEQSYDSSNNLIGQSIQTAWTINYRAGLLFQLDWIEKSIDPNTHVNAISSSGLQNTFLDIFYQNYGQTNNIAKNSLNEISNEGIDFQSENFGVGLKLEF